MSDEMTTETELTDETFVESPTLLTDGNVEPSTPT